MRPGPAQFDRSGRFQKWTGPIIEQAKLEFLKTHSAISILIQFVKQVF